MGMTIWHKESVSESDKDTDDNGRSLKNLLLHLEAHSGKAEVGKACILRVH